MRYRYFIGLMLTLETSLSIAGESIAFKQPFSPKNGWLTYGSALVFLLFCVLLMAKKYKPGSSKRSSCQLIEKKHLGNKTVVYIIDYEKQRFLLADNQQALAVYPLSNGDTVEPS